MESDHKVSKKQETINDIDLLNQEKCFDSCCLHI